ncbi:MAG: ATP-binding protein [Vicinamibacteria bacterium]
MLSALLVGLELLGLAGLALLLHRGSRRFGLAPLLAFLSGLAVLAQGGNTMFVLSESPRFVLNASVVSIPVVFLAVLVLYALDGTVAARQAIVAIVGLCLLVYYAAGFDRLRVLWLGPDSVTTLVPGPRTRLEPLTVLASIGAFAAGLHAMVIAHQLVRNRVPRLAAWAAPGIAILAGLWADSLVFSTLYSLPELDRMLARVARDLSGKTAAALLLWPLAAAYVSRAARWHPAPASREARPAGDVLFGLLGRIEADLSRARGDLRQERDLLARLMATSPVGIVRVDRAGRISFANAAAERVLRLSRVALADRSYDDPRWRITDEAGEPFPHANLPFERVRATLAPVYGVRHALEWEPGRRSIVSINAAPLVAPSGEFDGMVAVVDDITDQRRAELERESLIRELERKNAELERFTFTVSHDLKSPLVTIRGFLGLIAESARKGDQRRLESDIKRVEGAAGRMERLLGELLELSRVGRQMSAPEALPFELVVSEAIALVEGSLRAAGVEVVVGTGLPVVLGDRTRLVQVVQNLLDNAVKFRGPSPTPLVRIGCRRGDGQEPFVLFVEDNGVGIEPRHHQKIFGLFDKLDARSAGTGVGLALVKRVVEIHGGRVWVESEGPDRGARFCFTLPPGDAAVSDPA